MRYIYHLASATRLGLALPSARVRSGGRLKISARENPTANGEVCLSVSGIVLPPGDVGVVQDVEPQLPKREREVGGVAHS